MAENQLFHYRAFLNEAQGAAIVEAEFHNWDSGERRHYDGTIQITDCSRSVALDVGFGDIEGARSIVRKLDRLLDAVQGLREAVVRAAKREFPGRKL